MEVIEVEQPEQKNPFVEETTVSTTQWPTWTPDDKDYDSGDYNSGQWEWSPPTSEKPAPCNPGSYDLVPGECNAFLTCTTNGVAQKSYCKEGLHWNQETLSCGWASDSDCVADADAPNVFYKEGNFLITQSQIHFSSFSGLGPGLIFSF